MQTATVEEVQAHLPELLKQLGTGEELLIVSEGKPVGRLQRVGTPPTRVRVLGRGQGKLISYIDDDEHLKDWEEYMP